MELERLGKRPAWKIHVPDKDIAFLDGHYGFIRKNLADDGDFIIRRSDGVFAYQFAVSFDDMDMGIDRVVRGRDLLSSTARQKLFQRKAEHTESSMQFPTAYFSLCHSCLP